MRNIVGGFYVKDVKVAIEKCYKSIVAGEKIEEELSFPESNYLSLLFTHYNVYEVD